MYLCRSCMSVYTWRNNWEKTDDRENTVQIKFKRTNGKDYNNKAYSNMAPPISLWGYSVGGQLGWASIVTQFTPKPLGRSCLDTYDPQIVKRKKRKKSSFVQKHLHYSKTGQPLFLLQEVLSQKVWLKAQQKRIVTVCDSFCTKCSSPLSQF